MKRKHGFKRSLGSMEPVFDVKAAIRRRRERRMDRNLARERTARQWADKQGFEFAIHNDGHHWVLKKPGLFVEWWPSSAKLVLNRDYVHDFHIHDWQQVIAKLQSAGCQPPPAQGLSSSMAQRESGNFPSSKQLIGGGSAQSGARRDG